MLFIFNFLFRYCYALAMYDELKLEFIRYALLSYTFISSTISCRMHYTRNDEYTRRYLTDDALMQ